MTTNKTYAIINLRKRKKGDVTMFDKNKYKACVVAAGKTSMEVAQFLGINETTYYRKLSNNGSFTRMEIQGLIQYLNIQNPIEIFFAV